MKQEELKNKNWERRTRIREQEKSVKQEGSRDLKKKSSKIQSPIGNNC